MLKSYIPFWRNVGKLNISLKNRAYSVASVQPHQARKKLNQFLWVPTKVVQDVEV